MQLKILLPFQVFAEHEDVVRIVAETRDGYFGILPHRLDCVAALVPGILIFQTAASDETMVAVDAGILVKTGPEVYISVRRAINGADLKHLRAVIEDDYKTLDESEQIARSVVAKLETGFVTHLHICTMDKLPHDRHGLAPSFAKEVGAKAARKLKAKRHPTPGVWFGLGMMGLIGWSVVLPTLGGAALGLWLDTHHPGRHAWTLALLVAGLVLGCVNAWHWVAKEDRAMRASEEDDDD